MKSFILIVCLILGTVTMTATDATTLHSFTARTIDGTDRPLAAYAGKVVLIVNVASFCGYTRQYTTLEELYRTYKDRGFVILGFPANDFGAQEPGTDEEIATFCKTKYDVSFDMFGKITVKGDGIAPLYGWLTKGGGKADLAGDIGWNFEKFLVGKDGRLLHRYKSGVEPMGPELRADVEAALKD